MEDYEEVSSDPYAHDPERGINLSDMDIEQMIGKNLILPYKFQRNYTDQEQKPPPCSYDARLGNTVYLLEADARNTIIHQDKRVLEELVKVSKPVSIESGYELKKGYTYVIPLLESVVLNGSVKSIKCSPKSSLGRLFINSRLISDFNIYFNELSSNIPRNEHINMYLMITPLAFNIIVHPGIEMAQLRFFSGYDSKLSERELNRNIERKPILYHRKKDGSLNPAEHTIINGGLAIHLDAKAENNNNLIGFKTRDTPEPIDLSKKRFYNPLDFFAPLIFGKNPLIINSNDCLLCSSLEEIHIPLFFSGELRPYSQSGYEGIEHYAGFFDAGFEATCVGERRSTEPKPVELIHGSVLSILDVYRTNRPKNPYGAGAHYQGQRGVTLPKFFKPFLM